MWSPGDFFLHAKLARLWLIKPAKVTKFFYVLVSLECFFQSCVVHGQHPSRTNLVVHLDINQHMHIIA